MDELLVALNPDPESRLAYLLRLPLGGGMVFRTSGTWPRTRALYCYPVASDEWPDTPDIIERAPIRSCVRRGAAIDLILDRARENRSQLVFTTARGRDAVFWQSPRTRNQARPNVTTPTARAAGIASLEILVDTREQYAYRFASQQVTTVKRALPCGDYGVTVDGRLVAVVERKSLADLVSSLINGKLRHALGDLAALPRAAVVVEEWTYRYLAAAHAWAHTELALAERIGSDAATPATSPAPSAPEPTTSEVRAWARAQGFTVPDRGRLRPDVWQAWRDAQQQ
jgi:hypothetical protein